MDTHNKQDRAPSCSGEMPLPLLRERWPWAELFTTAPTFRGRYLLRYPTNEDVPITGLPELAHILPIAESGPYRCPLLAPSHEGLKQFGLLGVPPETNLGEERSALTWQTMHRARWLFAVEWIPDQPAWDALLFTLDHLNPLLICMQPVLVLPTLFVARLADQPQSSVFETILAWAPLLDEIQQRLLALLLALYLHWSEGPSQTARALREADTEVGEILRQEAKAFFQNQLAAFVQVFGQAWLDALLHTERLVPAVLRLIDWASRRLWDPLMPLSAPQQAAFRDHPDLHALLPLMFWDAQAPLSFESVDEIPRSLEHLFLFWQSRQGENGGSGDSASQTV